MAAISNRLRRRDRRVTQASLPPAGWYPDPCDPGGLRWWDGSSWRVDYDDLRARDVIALLPECSAEDLRWLRSHEHERFGRKTVLDRVDRLLAG